MGRTKGAKNITQFGARKTIASSPNTEIRHLASTAQETVLESFLGLVRHQGNYANWIQTRHDDLKKVKDELEKLKKSGARSPKDATFRKYKWYSEYLVLLEAINAYEVFYKRTIVCLATALRDYVPADRLKGNNIDARILWTAPPSSHASDLIFEHQLYHDLDNVDKATESLIQAKRYLKNSPKPRLRATVRTLQAIFQVRHTLSHNHGLLTASDAGKLKLLGYSATAGEVIDPDRDYLGQVIVNSLQAEAKDFTSWILSETATYLKDVSTSAGLALSHDTLSQIEARIGKSPALSVLPWV